MSLKAPQKFSTKKCQENAKETRTFTRHESYLTSVDESEQYLKLSSGTISVCLITHDSSSILTEQQHHCSDSQSQKNNRHFDIHCVPKNGPPTVAVTLSKLNWFSKLFHCQKEEYIVNKNLIIYRTTRSVCCRTTSGNLKFKFATNYKHHVWWNETCLVTWLGR